MQIARPKALQHGEETSWEMHILLVDDNPSVLEGLRFFLEAEDNNRVVGTAHCAEAAVSKARELNPNIAIIDFDLPDLDGLEVAREILEVSPQTRVIMLSTFDIIGNVERARKVGINYWLSKSEPPTLILKAIESMKL